MLRGSRAKGECKDVRCVEVQKCVFVCLHVSSVSHCCIDITNITMSVNNILGSVKHVKIALFDLQVSVIVYQWWESKDCLAFSIAAE